MNLDFLLPIFGAVDQQQPPIPQQPQQLPSWTTPGINPTPLMVGSQPSLPSAGVPQSNPLGWMERMNQNPEAWLALGAALSQDPQVQMGPMGSLVTTTPGLGTRLGQGFAAAKSTIQANEDRTRQQQESAQQAELRNVQLENAKIDSRFKTQQIEQGITKTQQEIDANDFKAKQAARSADLLYQQLQAEVEKAGTDAKSAKLAYDTAKRKADKLQALADKYPELEEQAYQAGLLAETLKPDEVRAGIRQKKAAANASDANAMESRKNAERLGAITKGQQLENEGLEAIPKEDRAKPKPTAQTGIEQTIANRVSNWEATNPAPTEPKARTQWLKQRAQYNDQIRNEEYQRQGTAKTNELATAKLVLESPDEWDEQTVANARTLVQQSLQNSTGKAGAKAPAKAVPKVVRDPKTGLMKIERGSGV